MVFSFLGGRSDGPPPPPRGPAELRAYWEALRQGMQIPSRADLDPRGMADILDRVFVGERIGQGIARLRIAGMALAELAGTDMKGLPLSSLFLPEARARLAEALELVLTGDTLVEMQLQAEEGIGRPRLDGRLLLLPLRPGKDGFPLVLGCLATDGRIGRAPRRFGIRHVIAERLGGLPVQRAITAPHRRTFAEPPVAPLAARPVSAPYLRLVHSAD